MRRLVPTPRPNPRDECVRPLGVAVLVGLFAVLCATTFTAPAFAQVAEPSVQPGTDPLAEADADVARLRQEADALAERYFDALAGLTDVQSRIDEIEARISALVVQVDDLRAQTRDRAVIAYKRAGIDLGSVIGADDVLRAARRVQWLDRLNARDHAAASQLRAMSAKLSSQRIELRTARESAASALAEVRTQGEAIDALLTDAEDRRRIAATPPSTVPPTDPTTRTATALPEGTTKPTTAPPSARPVAPPAYTPTPGAHPRHGEPFMVCTRARESSGNYGAYNPAGPYMGAYQFLQTTWNSAANHAGRPGLIGVPPHTASQYDQDDLGWALYQWQGSRPWGGHCDPE